MVYEPKCCLENICKYEHDLAKGKKHAELMTKKLVIQGRLFGAQNLCLWCLTHIEMLAKIPLIDREVNEIKELREKFPNYARVIDHVGLEKVRLELKMQTLEVEPSSTPTRLDQTENYPRLSVTVTGMTNELEGLE